MAVRNSRPRPHLLSPRGYVEMLERHEYRLEVAVMLLYKLLQDGLPWPGDIPDQAAGPPSTHSILASLIPDTETMERAQDFDNQTLQKSRSRCGSLLSTGGQNMNANSLLLLEDKDSGQGTSSSSTPSQITPSSTSPSASSDSRSNTRDSIEFDDDSSQAVEWDCIDWTCVDLDVV